MLRGINNTARAPDPVAACRRNKTGRSSSAYIRTAPPWSRAAPVCRPQSYVEVPTRSIGQSTNSQPRIDAVILIRPAKPLSFHCKAVSVELQTEQKVAPSSAFAGETIKLLRVFIEPSVYAPPPGEFSQEVIGLDIPVLIPLDKSVIASGWFEAWGAFTTHRLVVSVSVIASPSGAEQRYLQHFTIPIKTYDTLPGYRQFTEVLCQTHTSLDGQTLVHLRLAASLVGPSDLINFQVQIVANHLHTGKRGRLQLRQVTAHVKEVFEGHDAGLPTRKEIKLFLETRQHDQVLSTQGHVDEFSVRLPQENDILALFSLPKVQDHEGGSVSYITATFNKNKNAKLPEGVPLTHLQGFTAIGKLFSLRYEIVVKVKMNHGKDVECVLPLTVSPFNKASCEYLLQWITKECHIARELFGRSEVARMSASHDADEMYQVLRRFRRPPTVYGLGDWAKLGYESKYID